VSVIAGVSVAHQDAGVEQVEAAAADEKRRVEALLARDRVREAFALSTCNRAESYVVVDDPAVGRRVLDDTLPALPDEAVECMGHEASLRHLLRVAAGLESLVLGEDQILGQVRRSYETARGAGALGELLDESVTKAIHVGERARSETAIDEGVVSLGSAAVELAGRERDLADATAVVVGAGEMGTLAARALSAAGVEELVVANRTVPHAEHVAEEVDTDAAAAGLDALATLLAEADVAVTATGSDDHVVAPEDLRGAGKTLVVDIGQPRDVAPAAETVEGVDLRDLDALEAVTERTHEQRRAAADVVEAMVDEEFERLLEQFKRRRADDVIATMYESAERVKERELEAALSKLAAHGDLTDDQREVVASLADALVGQLLAAPTKSLRDAAAEDDWTTIDTALQLFDPEFGPASSDPESPSAPDWVPEDAERPDDVDVGGTEGDGD
jgi:glutamyl-tRNA reductase